MVAEWIVEQMDAVPAAVGFPGPYEVADKLESLAGRYPARTQWTRIGASRLGDPIHMLTIGAGEHSALVYAGPHSNEPVGFLTVVHLAELLLRDDRLCSKLGYTWHLIGCIDPDAAFLDRGWYGGPFTRRNYARHFYRPPFNQQAEWTFPVRADDAPIYFDDPLPETRALMHAIDTVQPDLMCSLHNAEFGGTYFYLNRDQGGLAAELADVVARAGLPLHAGDAELPDSLRWGTGVFAFPTVEQIHGIYTGTSRQASFGAASNHYADRYETLSLVVEVPLWTDPRSMDSSGSGQSRANLLLDVAQQLAETDRAIGSCVDATLDILKAPDSPFVSALADLRRIICSMAGSYQDHAESAGDVEATIAEQFQLIDDVHLFQLRSAGTALRLLDAELAIGHHPKQIRDAHAAAEQLFIEWADAAEAYAPGTAVRPATLAAVQLGAILASADALAATG